MYAEPKFIDGNPNQSLFMTAMFFQCYGGKVLLGIERGALKPADIDADTFSYAESLVPRTDQSLEFLNWMFPNEPRHLVAIFESRIVGAANFEANESAKMVKWIDKHQGVNNLYFHVNQLKSDRRNIKAKKEDIDAALFQHVDIDDLKGIERIKTYEPKPTAVVFSGGGYQAFWRLDQPSSDLEAVERRNKAITKALGGDNCHNIDRIMRLPGTINILNTKKRKAGRVPALAYVVEEATDWSRSYSLDRFPQANTQAVEVNSNPANKSIKPVDLDAISVPISQATRNLIVDGDNLERPIGSKNAKYPSRSEAVYRVTCDLVRARVPDAEITGILVNSKYGISASIREKRKPIEYAMRQVRSAKGAVSTDWPDTNKGKLQPTLRNTMLAIRRLGLYAKYDEFHNRKRIGGHALQSYAHELSDDGCAVLRNLILSTYGFDPGKDHTREAANILCHENIFHPVRDYLVGLKWDNIPSIGSWLHIYLGAENNELNQAIGRIMLVAAVRRIRQPGAKFDTIVVLEGPQGLGKSTALKILAGDENFSDQEVLTLDAKAQAEALEGKWIYELCDLEGLSRADTNKVKAFASRDTDRARPAYGRFREDKPRQNIFVGTTNDDKYLRDMTGNRRFWPVKTGVIDLEALARDREQLWAEAAYWEAKDISIILAQELWPAAAREQEERLETDPWLDELIDLKGGKVGVYERISTRSIFLNHLTMPVERQQTYHTKRLAQVMRKLGWEGPRLLKFEDGSTKRGYQRKISDGED